jgi:hypothetical protein
VIRDERQLFGSHYNRQVEDLVEWLASARKGTAAGPDLVRTAGAGAQPQRPPAPARPSPEEAAAAERLKGVEFGTWFELRPDGEERPRRVKLSWHNPTTARYMFVNQDGVTAAVKEAPALIRELARGETRIVSLPERPFVERALQTVRNAVERSLGISLSSRQNAKEFL